MQCSYCFWMNVWHWSKLSVYHCKQAISSWLLGEGYRPTSTSILHRSSSRSILARVTPAKCQNANLAVFGGLLPPHYGEVSILSDWFPTAIVAKYLTSTSSSCWSFSRFGSI